MRPEGKQDQTYYSRELARQIRLASLPSAVLEYPFAKTEGRGWRIIRVSTKQVRTGEGLKIIDDALARACVEIEGG